MKRHNTFNKIIITVLACIMIMFVTSCGKQEVTSLSDGKYKADITMEGGTGKAYIQSPVTINVTDGQIEAVLVWSSVNYDYMIVNDVRYDNETPGSNSTFTIPVNDLEEPLTVIADTVAMSTPHEIEYVLHFSLRDDKVDFSQLEKTDSMELTYATQFNVDYYEDYALVYVVDDASYLIVPEGLAVPDNVPEDVIILKKPFDKTYLVSTSVMDLVREIDAISDIRLSGTEIKDWYIREAKDAMEAGDIVYAGKYSAPDYEVIMASGCNLAIENTMIYHCPEVKEKLEELGIPVFVERSSYESHPLGRLEWIKLYGLLYDRLDIANEYFNSQISMADSFIDEDKTDLTVSFFYVTTNGSINVRKPGDYISKMIDMSGATYALDGYLVEEDNALSTMNMQMEDFYLAAKDADIIIYNSTIDGEISSINELIAKSSIFEKFKAVEDGNVYCTSKNFFQETTGMAEFMKELNDIFTGNDNDNELTYLKKLY